jgi:hypothetical protein
MRLAQNAAQNCCPSFEQYKGKRPPSIQTPKNTIVTPIDGGTGKHQITSAGICR